jgi:hypothetical protein
METPGERLQRGPPVHLSDGDQEVQAGSSDGEEGEADMVGEGEDDPAQPTAVPPQPPRIATPGKRGRPMGSKSAKEEERQRVHREHVARAQGRVSAEMATANRAKAQVLEDQSTLHIFMMLDSETLSEEARKYLALRREEELMKIRVKVAERKALLAKQEVARKKAEATAAREAVAREEEIQAATARRNPTLAPQRSTPWRQPAPAAAGRSPPPAALAGAPTAAPTQAPHPPSPYVPPGPVDPCTISGEDDGFPPPPNSLGCDRTSLARRNL